MDLRAAIVAGDDKSTHLRALSQYHREYGRGLALEIRIFREFRDRLVRATFHKILTRLETFQVLLCAKPSASDNTLDLAQDWIPKQLSETVSLAAQKADLELKDRGRIAFLGFRAATRRRTMRALSFEDEPPPWRFHLGIEIEGLNEDEKQQCLAANRPKIEEMLCPEHGRPPHAYFVGRRGNFTVEVEACCEDFTQSVRDHLISTHHSVNN